MAFPVDTIRATPFQSKRMGRPSRTSKTYSKIKPSEQLAEASSRSMVNSEYSCTI